MFAALSNSYCKFLSIGFEKKSSYKTNSSRENVAKEKIDLGCGLKVHPHPIIKRGKSSEIICFDSPDQVSKGFLNVSMNFHNPYPFPILFLIETVKTIRIAKRSRFSAHAQKKKVSSLNVGLSLCT